MLVHSMYTSAQDKIDECPHSNETQECCEIHTLIDIHADCQV